VKKGWEGLTEYSKSLYVDTYFKANESYDSWLYKVSHKYANDYGHGNRIASYIYNYWFHPSTPISSDAGLPIACYTSHVGDNNDSIFDSYEEGMHLGALGGGRGVYWGDVGGAGRPIGIPVDRLSKMSWSEIQQDDNIPKSPGVIPFLGVSDRATYAVSQANVRRSTEAAYIPIWHPDIVGFKDIRLETGDRNRRTPNLHHGICINNAFLDAVENLKSWDLICPHTGKITDTVDAYDLWIDILITRKTEAGEPYLINLDTINEDNPIEYSLEGYLVTTSNICTEVTLHTSPEVTGVCCLASLNVEYWEEYKDNISQIVADISDYLDNVLTYTLKETEGKVGFDRVRRSIKESRDIGIGIMGLHSLLQSKNIAFESPMARGLNSQVISAIKFASDKHQESLPHEVRCDLSKKHSTHKRNLHSLAIAPTMSISTLSNLCSSGVEPWVANAFVKKIPTGSISLTNKYLEQYISDFFNEAGEGYPSAWVSQQWSSIKKHNGSVQHFDWMPDNIKDVYKTAFEIDQRAIITLAADRQKIMVNEQAQSINLFMPAEVSYEELHTVHMMAFRQGLKSLYYLRSQPATTADTSSKARKEIVLEDDVCIMCT